MRKKERRDRFLSPFRDFTCALLTHDYATARREGGGERDGGGGAGAALVPVAQPHYLRSSLRRLGN